MYVCVHIYIYIYIHSTVSWESPRHSCNLEGKRIIVVLDGWDRFRAVMLIPIITPARKTSANFQLY